MIAVHNIVANPKGYLMRVLEVQKDEVLCQYLNAPITHQYQQTDLRFLSPQERPPVPHNPDFEQLIQSRNIIVANYIPSVRRPQGRPSKKKKSLAELIMAAKSQEEVLALVASHGFVNEEEIDDEENLSVEQSEVPLDVSFDDETDI